MSFLATALRAYPGVGTIELYRKCWRLTDSKGKPIGNNNMLLVTGLKEKMYLVNLDTNQKSQYALTTADAAADDWVVKTKSVSLQGMPNQPFFFYSAFHKSLNQNKLITLSEWKEERFVCISGAENPGAFGMVYFNGNIFINHTDWYPTPAELLDNNWYSLDRYAPITITKELQTSYLDYAMSVIVSRALPDVRDGFKPVHRRVIYAQHALGNTKQNAFKKSARVVGDVIGKYHPHGDSAVYEAIVRMAQPFSLRYPLIDGQGNFGSVDGDSAAAMRYTEVRMENITGHMLTDLEKDTVDWVDNYDGSEIIPDVLPTRFPNLVINGSSGIAVAMATNMPPHNLTETIKATVALIQNPNLSNKELFAIIPAPDFPTGGTIRGLSGAQKAMATGKGRVIITSKFHMEQKTNGIMNIVFSEIPYGVNKARIITKIAEAVTSKKLEGIGHIQDESDREGMRIVVTCKRDSNADVVLNNLLNGDYGLEVGFSVNNMAIVNGLPKLFSMREMLLEFINFRREVVMRRTRFEIEEMRKRAHILEGQIAALLNIDVCIETIKKSKDTSSAIEALGKLVFDGKGIRKILGKYDRIDPNVELGFSANEAKYRLHPSQAKDIVNMRLARLTGLEKEKLCAEFLQIIQNIAYLWTIINDLNVLNTVIINECLQTIPPNDQRKTIIDLKEHRVATVEELLPDQPIVVTMSKMGWIKQQELSTYNAQRRGGRGKTATALKEDDYVRLMITASSHQTIMLLTSLGRIHCVKGYELPSGSSGGRGKPIQNHIALQDGEEVTAIIPIREYGENEYMVIATRQGKIKRTSLDQFSNIRSTGIIAIALNDGDAVIGCKITDGSSEIMLFSSDSKAIRFEEQQVRAMGRQAGGIAGITLSENAYVNSLIVAHDDADVLCVCANGYGKRTKVAEFSKHNRGGKGLISINASDRNGAFIGAVAVESDSEIMICSDDGIVIRTDSQGIAKTSRNAQGVKLINLAKGARVSAVETINIIDTSITKAKPLVKKKRISK